MRVLIGEGSADGGERPISRLILIGLLIRRQSTMLGHAATLSAGAGTTAVLGFCYWWYAARMFPAEAVGYAAAAISVMNLLALVSELGMGTLLIGELSKARDEAQSLVAAALLLTSVSAVISGLLYLALSGQFCVDLGSITSSSVNKVMFVVGLAVTGFTLVLDQAFVAMLRSTLQISRTTAFAASKLLLLCSVGALGAVGELDIFATWIGGQVVSMLLLWIICVYRRERVWYTPRLTMLRPLLGVVLKHHLLSIVIQAPGLILPFIVAVILSPQTNAAFYAAWTLVNVILLVPASLTSILYSVASREPDSLTHRLKISLGVSAFVTTIAGFGLLYSSDFVLRIFNPLYPSIAGSSLSILGFGAIGVMMKYHYVVVQRIRYRMLDASVLLSVFGVVELVAAIRGARNGGLFGLTENWLIAVVLEAFAFIPLVFRALRGEFSAIAPRPSAVSPHVIAQATTVAGSTQHLGEIPCAT